MWFLAVAFAAVPAVTPDEAARLAAGEIVIRNRNLAGGVSVVGLADIEGAEAAIWEALLDFPGRRAGNPSIRAVAPYRESTATEQWMRWEISRFGFTVVYHNHYVIDRPGRKLTHELDPSQPNDLAMSHGVYDLLAIPTGFRLSYEVETNFGRAIPGFVQEWLAGSGVKTFLGDVVARAEAG